LSLDFNRVGNARLAAGDRTGALSGYEESLAIMRKLVTLDPENHDWQTDMAASLDKVGDTRLAAGKRAGALSAYEDTAASQLP
jgi:Flp pilus assembly protein TadD